MSLARAARGVARRCRELRNAVEWRSARAIRREAPWSTNRWGQRYQSASLAEYHDLRDGNPETFESALIERTLRPGMTVVDVGANHGLFSLEAAHLVGPAGRVFAFEPTPATLELLRSNLRANGLERVATLAEAGGEAPGVARLRVHRERTGLNTLAAGDITWNRRVLVADAVVEVPITTIDLAAEALGLGRIDFLKVDVEGFELGVIRGAREMLEARRVDRILLEVRDLTCRNAGVEPGEVLAELATLGYTLHAITPRGEVGDRVVGFPAGSFSANYLALPPKG